jgi:hypothetical protein
VTGACWSCKAPADALDAVGECCSECRDGTIVADLESWEVYDEAQRVIRESAVHLSARLLRREIEAPTPRQAVAAAHAAAVLRDACTLLDAIDAGDPPDVTVRTINQTAATSDRWASGIERALFAAAKEGE